jgi:hypothetical protein
MISAAATTSGMVDLLGVLVSAASTITEIATHPITTITIAATHTGKQV